MSAKNNDCFRAINAVSEKLRRRKGIYLKALGGRSVTSEPVARWGSVETGVAPVKTCGPAGAGGPAETCVFADGSVGTVLLYRWGTGGN